MISDEQLQQAAAAGDPRATRELVDRFTGFVKFTASGYFLPDGDTDDVVQEGLIGVYKAIRDYQPGHGTTFASFAKLCVTRQIWTAIKTSTRLKHGQLTSAVRAARFEGEEEIFDVLETIADPRAHVVEQLHDRDRIRLLVDVINSCLTPLERESLLGFVFLDETYAETEARIFEFDGDRAGRAAYSPVKVVDNALSRARRKIRDELEAAGFGEPRPLGAAA